MASITKLSNSNYVSSLYNSSNIISGLASGMDTEGMIENLTKSYQSKITQLQQKSTKLEWKQEAYRSIISKIYSYSNKYTSYTSSTNLLSQSFFNAARTSSVDGKYANKVSASGTTTSDVVLNSVDQLATAARYATQGNFGGAGTTNTIEASGKVDLTGDKAFTEVNGLQGSISLVYGSKSVSVSFSESDKILSQKKDDGTMENQNEALARVINEKLSKETIALSSGSSIAASDRIKAVVSSDGKSIEFKPADTNAKGEDRAGNSIYISDGYGSFKGIVPDGTSSDDKKKIKSFDVPATTYDGTRVDDDGNTTFFRKDVANTEKISGKTFNINMDGVSKQVKGPLVTQNSDGTYTLGGELDKNGKQVKGRVVKAEDLADEYTKELNKAVQAQFGTKVKVTNEAGATDFDTNGNKSLKLKFEVPENSEILINTDAGDALKIGKVASNYLSTGKTLEDLLGKDGLKDLEPAYETDDNGDFVLDADGNKKVKTDAKGNTMYDFKINGVTVGSYTKDTTLATIMSDINKSEANVNVSYSKTSREFVFTSKDTGEHTKVELGDGLAQKMFSTGGVNKNTSIKSMMDDSSGPIKDKKISLEIDGKTYEYTLTGENGTLKHFENAINSKIGEDGYKASFTDNGSLEIKNSSGETVNYSFTKDDQIGAQVVKNVQKNQGYTAGQDAKFTVTVNGTEKTMTRSTNKADIDGMTINFKGTFNQGYSEMSAAEKKDTEGVTFQTTIQADNVVDGVKNMIAELNVLLAETRSQYATMPAQSSNGSFKNYEPLTDEDRASMSESAIKNYEEKAKQGLLFADSNLSGLYNNLVSVFNRSGEDATMMKNMGIGISYDTNGAATITLDENKFRKALEDDFDGVVDMFTRSKENGAATDGIMQGIKTQMDRYGATTGSVKGILVQQAGTPLASLSLLDNAWQKQLDSISSDIEKWGDKLKKQVDKYTSMFSRMEVLINQMNQQSSQLASMMGG